MRQGTDNEEVEIFRYVTEGTFDAYLYQLVENNDTAGRLAAQAIQTVIPREYEVKNLPPPRGKDVNDTLCHQLGIPIRSSHHKEPER